MYKFQIYATNLTKQLTKQLTFEITNHIVDDRSSAFDRRSDAHLVEKFSAYIEPEG
jgi:Na+-transporting NADH:ubiquinone oxidoreductase subunit NqrD